MILKLPTAWLQLKYQKTRLLVALAGVVFAILIIFMQLGLRDALFDSSVRLYQALKGDCYLISPRSPSLVAMDNLPQRRLSQVLAFDEVELVSPVYLSFLQWRNFQQRDRWRNIFMIGVDLRHEVFDLPGVRDNFKKLQMPDAILFDRNGRNEYGPVVDAFERDKKVVTEVRTGGKNHRVEVAGLFELGTSFGIDGTIMTSHLNFLRITDSLQQRSIHLGVIDLKPGVAVQDFTEKLRQFLPPDVRVLTKAELIEFEKTYWRTGTAVGFIFSLGVILGIIVGMVVVYQILYTNVSEHLAEFATLKAIGYRHRYLLSVVLQQSALIAILGYFPGLLVSKILYELTRQATLLPIEMNVARAITVFVLTLVMCFSAGATAVDKLKAADPADIF